MKIFLNSTSTLTESLWKNVLEQYGVQIEAQNLYKNLQSNDIILFTEPFSNFDIINKSCQKYPNQQIVFFIDERLDNQLDFPSQVVGLIRRDTSINEVIDCLSSVNKGKRYVSPNLVLKAKEPFNNFKQELSTREIEVLKLYADRLNTKAIADKLFISHFTVQNHSKSIQKKLNLSGRHCIIRHSEYLRAQGLL
jgi:DNA-binding NarL/FixJ family response regulator